MQELWFLNDLKVFLMYYTEKSYFTHTSISIALADLMWTIYPIWKKSLNIETYLKLQNCVRKSNLSVSLEKYYNLTYATSLIAFSALIDV